MEGKLGTTKLSVSALGLGLAALGRPGYINLGHAEDLQQDYQPSAMETHTHQILDRAFAGGIRYFDAARSYGRAENFFASWVETRNISPDELTLGSKWGYTYTADWQVNAETHEVKQHSRDNFQRQLKISRELLGDYLDLYQIHSATLDSGVLENQPVLEALGKLKDQGTAVGLSVSGPRQEETIFKALEIPHRQGLLFDCVQATWNLLERSAGPALAAASQAGLGVIIKEALANGRLTSRNTSPEFRSQRKQLEKTARELDTTLENLALAAVLNQPWVDVTLSGAARKDHLEANLQALQLPWEDQLLEDLSNLQETPREYWEFRSRLEWQ